MEIFNEQELTVLGRILKHGMDSWIIRRFYKDYDAFIDNFVIQETKWSETDKSIFKDKIQNILELCKYYP